MYPYFVALFLNLPAISNGQNIEVIVKNVKNDKGTLMVGLFNSEKTFTIQSWKGEKPRAAAGTVKVIFQNIPSGEYAVSVYHDANEMLDVNFIGIPKEGFGFSNDVMGTFGPPTFEKAKFKCPVSQPISVTLKYF